MPFGSHGMMQGESHQPFPGQMRTVRPGMGVGLAQPGMRLPHMMSPGHYAMTHRQMPPYSEVPRPEVKLIMFISFSDGWLAHLSFKCSLHAACFMAVFCVAQSYSVLYH